MKDFFRKILSSKKYTVLSIVAVVLVLAVIITAVAVGCQSEEQPGGSTGGSSLGGTDATGGQNPGGSNPGDTTEPGGSVPPTPPAELGGEGIFTFESTMIPPRKDYKEVRPGDLYTTGTPANQMAPMTGGSDAQADAMRSEILNAKDTLEHTGTVYYISPSGDNKNDGLSVEKPVQTIDALYALESGDTVLFERGGIWRLNNTIKAKDGVTYGAYGEGEKPCLYGSPKNYADASMWTPSRKANVWKLSITYSDVGSIIFDHGTAVGIKKSAGLNQLEKTGDYYHNEDNDTLYLYCAEGNPGKVYKDIEMAVKVSIFTLSARTCNVTIDNLCLKYAGEFAVNAVGYNDNIVITNCEMGYIGGCQLTLSVRYGNAIQFWDSCKNVVVENNWMYQCFDTALTFQGVDGNAVYSDISFCNNLFEYNDMDIEIWDTHSSFVITDLKIENNIMRFNSFGWGTRPEDASNRGGSACLKFTMHQGKLSNVTIKNNVFDCPAYAAVYWLGDRTATIGGNSFYAASDRWLKTDFLRYDNNYMKYATDQESLQDAVSAFDKAAAKVQWIER